MIAPAFVHVTVVPAATVRSRWVKSTISRLAPAAASGGATVAVEAASGVGIASRVGAIVGVC